MSSFKMILDKPIINNLPTKNCFKCLLIGMNSEGNPYQKRKPSRSNPVEKWKPRDSFKYATSKLISIIKYIINLKLLYMWKVNTCCLSGIFRIHFWLLDLEICHSEILRKMKPINPRWQHAIHNDFLHIAG